MESNYIELSTILLIIKFSIACDLSFQQLKTCKIMDVGTENIQDSRNLRLDSIINEKKAENELYNLRFYVQTGVTGTFVIDAGQNVEARDCKFVHIYVNKYTSKTTWKEGVYIRSYFPDHCDATKYDNAQNNEVTYGPVDLNEHIPLLVRIVITKDGKYTVYISKKESVSYTFPKTFTPIGLDFTQFHDPKGRGRLFYNCTFKE